MKYPTHWSGRDGQIIVFRLIRRARQENAYRAQPKTGGSAYHAAPRFVFSRQQCAETENQ